MGYGRYWILYGYLVHDDVDVTKKTYAVYLITAAHVIKEHFASGRPSMHVRLDAIETSSGSREFEIPNSEWFFHPDANVDLAATPIPINFLKDRGLQSSFFPSDGAVATKSRLQEIATSVGDGVFILGFPMNLTGEQRNYVIVRQGAVARISELFEGASTTFLADFFVFPEIAAAQ